MGNIENNQFYNIVNAIDFISWHRIADGIWHYMVISVVFVGFVAKTPFCQCRGKMIY